MIDDSAFEPGFGTLALHAAGDHSGAMGANSLLEERVAILEGGTAAVATGSGQAALLRLLHALLDPGDGLVVSTDYHLRQGLILGRAAEEFGWSVVTIDPAAPEAVAGAITPATRVVLVESLTRTGRFVDVATIAEIAKRAGALILVDNTLATPALVRPVEHGAQAVVHVGTALLAGREGVEGGLVVDGGGEAAAVPKLARPMPHLGGESFAGRYGNFALAAAVRASVLGSLDPGPSPSTESALLAGLGTLSLRLARQLATAREVARHLAAHPAVAQLGEANGPLLPVRLRAAPPVGRYQLFGSATAPGCTRSLVIGSDDGASHTLFIGLEDPADLIADLDQALA